MDALPQRVLRLAAPSRDGIVITDKRGVTVWANEAFTDLCGYTPDELVGEKPGKLLQGAKTDKAAVAGIRRNLRKGEAVSEVLLNYHKDGSPYWVVLTIQPIHDNRGSVRLFAAVQRKIPAEQAASPRRFADVPDLHLQLRHLVDELSYAFAGRKRTVDPFSKRSVAGTAPARPFGR
ncbi:MAG: PAS domain-containing protein [Opitutales bacterium]